MLLIGLKISSETMEQIENILKNGNGAYKNMSELLRDCINEGIPLVQKRVYNGNEQRGNKGTG